MTVRELIEELSKASMDARIFVRQSGEDGFICTEIFHVQPNVSLSCLEHDEGVEAVVLS